MKQAKLFHGDVNACLLTSNSTEWYTPQKYVDAARQVMGSIDTDPASNEIANRVIRAGTYYTKETNGFDKAWAGNVWLNPPYGHDGKKCNQSRWSQKLLESYQAGITAQAVLLVNASIGTKWFNPLMEYTICFPDHRINFYTFRDIKHGATHGSALVYLGSNVGKFAQVFSQFGKVMCSIEVTRPETLWSVA